LFFFNNKRNALLDKTHNGKSFILLQIIILLIAMAANLLLNLEIQIQLTIRISDNSPIEIAGHMQ